MSTPVYQLQGYTWEPSSHLQPKQFLPYEYAGAGNAPTSDITEAHTANTMTASSTDYVGSQVAGGGVLGANDHWGQAFVVGGWQLSVAFPGVLEQKRILAYRSIPVAAVYDYNSSSAVYTMGITSQGSDWFNTSGLMSANLAVFEMDRVTSTDSVGSIGTIDDVDPDGGVTIKQRYETTFRNCPNVTIGSSSYTHGQPSDFCMSGLRGATFRTSVKITWGVGAPTSVAGQPVQVRMTNLNGVQMLHQFSHHTWTVGYGSDSTVPLTSNAYVRPAHINDEPWTGYPTVGFMDYGFPDAVTWDSPAQDGSGNWYRTWTARIPYTVDHEFIQGIIIQYPQDKTGVISTQHFVVNVGDINDLGAGLSLTTGQTLVLSGKLSIY